VKRKVTHHGPMNSKERVLAAINHLEPDRVPVDLWALPPVTDRLRNHFGV